MDYYDFTFNSLLYFGYLSANYLWETELDFLTSNVIFVKIYHLKSSRSFSFTLTRYTPIAWLFVLKETDCTNNDCITQFFHLPVL